MKNTVSIVLVVSATLLALKGVDGWGWLIFAAVVALGF